MEKMDTKEESRKSLLLLLFFGIPGIGKSCLVERLLKGKETEEIKYDIHVVCSDKVRGKAMEIRKKSNPSEPQEQLMKKCQNIYKSMFISEIGKIIWANKIEKAIQFISNSTIEESILIIDKIHVQNGIQLSLK